MTVDVYSSATFGLRPAVSLKPIPGQDTPGEEVCLAEGTSPYTWRVTCTPDGDGTAFCKVMLRDFLIHQFAITHRGEEETLVELAEDLCASVLWEAICLEYEHEGPLKGKGYHKTVIPRGVARVFQD